MMGAAIFTSFIYGVTSLYDDDDDDDDDDDNVDDDAGANSVESQVASVHAAKNGGIADTAIVRRFTQQHRLPPRKYCTVRLTIGNTQLDTLELLDWTLMDGTVWTKYDSDMIWQQ